MSDDLLVGRAEGWLSLIRQYAGMDAYHTFGQVIARLWKTEDERDALAAEVRRLRDTLNPALKALDAALDANTDLCARAADQRARAEAAEQRLTQIRQLCDDPWRSYNQTVEDIRRILDAEATVRPAEPSATPNPARGKGSAPETLTDRPLESETGCQSA